MARAAETARGLAWDREALAYVTLVESLLRPPDIHLMLRRAGRSPSQGGTVNQHPTVAVIGLGYVGLPLAIAFAESGCRVVGADASPARVGRAACRRVADR